MSVDYIRQRSFALYCQGFNTTLGYYKQIGEIMAGVLKVTTKVNLTGLGEEVDIENEATMTVPVEHQEGYTVVEAAQTTAIQLFDMVDHIALDKIYGVFIKAEVGTIYLLPDTAGTATFAAAAADLVLNVGESCWLPINPAGNLGCKIDASAVTDAFSWMIVGKA
jgi:hypothetical protein